MDSRKRELGPWPLVIGAVIIILAAVWFFTNQVPAPKVPPSSPAAEGTAGVPSGADGLGEQPGSPAELEDEHAPSNDPNSPEPAGTDADTGAGDDMGAGADIGTDADTGTDADAGNNTATGNGE